MKYPKLPRYQTALCPEDPKVSVCNTIFGSAGQGQKEQSGYGWQRDSHGGTGSPTEFTRDVLQSFMEVMMVAFSRIKEGDVLFDAHMQKMGNTNISKLGVWRVTVKEIDHERKQALCSWNGNRPEWWSEHRLSRLRRSDPTKPPKTAVKIIG